MREYIFQDIIIRLMPLVKYYCFNILVTVKIVLVIGGAIISVFFCWYWKCTEDGNILRRKTVVLFCKVIFFF